jgi:hypothetical protein
VIRIARSGHASIASLRELAAYRAKVGVQEAEKNSVNTQSVNHNVNKLISSLVLKESVCRAMPGRRHAFSTD